MVDQLRIASDPDPTSHALDGRLGSASWGSYRLVLAWLRRASRMVAPEAVRHPVELDPLRSRDRRVSRFSQSIPWDTGTSPRGSPQRDYGCGSGRAAGSGAPGPSPSAALALRQTIQASAPIIP